MALPISETFVAQAERELGRALPGWLRVRLMQENGGSVQAGGETWHLFSVLDTTDRKRLARSASHIVNETRVAREWPGFPKVAIAIGDNGTGDLLVLLPDENHSGSLLNLPYRWMHDSDEPPVPVDLVT